MNAEQKKTVKSIILECRDILEKDIEQVLINYGIYKNKVWVNLRDLRNLTEEQENNRKNIEKAIEKLEKGGFEKDKAVMEYIKEVSYTYLNRLAALRVMEVRGLIDEILVPRGEYGNRSFIGSRFYEVAREFCKYEMDGGLGYLLNIMFEEISEEIKMLFNTEDEYSFVTPSSTSLLKVIELLCSNIDEESWRQDEIIGWIYQYFNEKEKDDVFDRLYNKKQKIKVEDIPAATQLFTPDWIVDWIVDNSLGTLWDEMKRGERNYKRVEEIKLLDPCCGSGHFLVKAFDLFYNMYVEEGIYTGEEIPYKILENNIYGIDIDLRAVQLTGLILFIKTKSYLKENGYDINTKGKLLVNLVCADAILLNGSRLEELKYKHKDNERMIKMIEIIYQEFEDVRLRGSLIRPEKKIFPLFEKEMDLIVDRERSKSRRISRSQTVGQESLIEQNHISRSEYKEQRDFTKEERELMGSLDTIYREAIKANDISRQLFANEAKKSLKLVDIFMQKTGYDVVVTNPPYLFKKNMTEKLKRYVEENYKEWSADLYSVFIGRCLEFLSTNGKLGMITQQSFMFITSYIKVRSIILENYYIEKLVHLGTRAFDEISGEKVNTVMFVIEKSNAENKKSHFIRLFDKKTSKEKMETLLRDNERKKYEYIIPQKKFSLIQGKPFVYWLSDEIYSIFEKNKEISHKYKVKSGMRIGANDKFLRFFWEVDQDKLGDSWKTYNKGGLFSRFFGPFEYVIDWSNDALEFYESNKSHRNKDLYFKDGVTYTLLSSSGFSVRIIPENAVFDANGPSIFCSKEDSYYLCGFLLSSMVSYLLNILNSTLAFTPTDVNKLPYIDPTEVIKNEVKRLAKVGYELSKFKHQHLECSLNFNKLLEISIGNCVKTKSLEDLLIIKQDIINLMDDLENRIIIDVDKYVFDLYELSEKEREKVCYQENKKIYDNYNYYKALQIDYTRFESENDIMQELLNLLKHKETGNYNKNIEIDDNLNFNEDMKDIISYIFGCLFGRYTTNGIDVAEDGILVVNNSIFAEDLTTQIYESIDKIFSSFDSEQTIDFIEKKLGKTVEAYIINDFYKEHIKRYEKRPIYWHICSPKKTFNCFVYYHKLDNDTLYKVKSIYLSQMIERYEDDLKYYNNQLIEARTNGDKSREKELKERCIDLEEKLEDLNLLDAKIIEILPYRPVINKGVLYNIIPIEPILSAPVATKRERDNYYEEVGK
ncbi:MAG: BREX-1 system adenine-specific DNA-methyltransferase PglX [Clostridium botulinum]|uniref:BREX-1 system adenine-specific DNA-methyltransferase PglX n=1 Tax=uncultured Clostridium sp. TaxID=59620 RepID=UPI00280B24B8|nr:BREX-1 system adenine-specific DNA-methyltransferase PglX [uncultured Clostridium sp.]MDU6878949.1 BREX-1 system adenine-specific DNA-methyltransferase PglX [Clostridium botulinum]